ncbi:aliphatic sulfonate ABC transporter substrate-binding protein [Sandarakinorhabdus sp. DWP1-3-1]|uniref:aliphatic sulfonate ABC transporter substrate-binding protein n=1 Tax=Sandarakinorhabdus sp. DWP1-3-1 TaxID=2804627 RepID=UPI003CF2CCD1
MLRVAGQRGTIRAVMAASRMLEGVPYRIEWSEFGAASPLLEALAAGAVDLGGVGEAPFAFAVANGAPIVAVMALVARSGGKPVAIVVPTKSPLGNAADLKDRKVATVRGSVGRYLLIRAAARAKIDPRRIDTVYLAPAEAKAAMAEGSVDAWATWSPYIGMATAGGQNRVLVDGSGLFSGLSFIAAHRDVVADKPELIGDFLGRLGRAQVWGRANIGHYASALAAETRLPLAVARDMIERQDLGIAAIDAGVAASTAETLRHFRDAGVIPTVPNLAGAFTERFNMRQEIKK